MDIKIIENEIELLESSELTVDNIIELASLYTIRNNYHPYSHSNDSEKFPYYHSYINAKREYQLDKTTEGCVIREMKNLCHEIEEFFDTLYSNTDMGKERRCIKELVNTLYEKYK